MIIASYNNIILPHRVASRSLSQYYIATHNLEPTTAIFIPECPNLSRPKHISTLHYDSFVKVSLHPISSTIPRGTTMIGAAHALAPKI